MAVADGDIIRVTAKTTIGTDEQNNVYHLIAQVTNPPTNAALWTMLALWLDSAYTYTAPLMSTGLNFTTIRADNLTQDEIIGEDDWPVLTVGGSSNQTMALQLAPVVRFITNTLGSQGRKFLAGYTTEGHNTRGLLLAAAVSGLTSFATEILSGAFAPGDYVLTPGNYNKTLARFVPWIAAQVNELFGTQRRRQMGSGS